MKSEYLAGGNETRQVFCTQVKHNKPLANEVGAGLDRVDTRERFRLGTMKPMNPVYLHAGIKVAGLE